MNKINDKEQDRYYQLNMRKLQALPAFVQTFFLEKHYSANTKYQYITELIRFFQWLIDNDLSAATATHLVSTADLNQLTTLDVNLYVDYLMNVTNRQAHHDTATTINRSINVLRSLFKYLHTTNDRQHTPYLQDNIMLKIPLLRQTETLNLRSKKIEKQMYRGQLKFALMAFIQNDYGQHCSPRALASYRVNKERDLALIATLFGTGARRSEIANLNVHDLNFNDHTVMFTRKGGMQDIVPFSRWIIPYLKAYLQVRVRRYGIKRHDDIKPLFVSKVRGQLHRLTAVQINNIVKKYTTAFGRPSTAHKFRHTTASELFHDEKDIMLVAQQLGQSSTSATALYTHINMQKQHQAMDRLGEEEQDD